MTAHELLDDLRRAGATVTIAGDKLRLEAPKGLLTEEFKQQLREYKPQIVRLLTTTSFRVGPLCIHCSKFKPIGSDVGCSKPGDHEVSMPCLLECLDFVEKKTVH